MSTRAVVALLIGIAAVACRSDRTPPAVAGDSAATAGAAPPANVVTYIARDYGFEGPGQIPAGSTVFRLDNQGKELHHLVVVRIDGGKTYDSLLAALRKPEPPPSWMHMVGGPNAITPSGTSNATVDLAGGHYAILCFIPGADGVPHLARGMISPLEVTTATGPAARTVPADVTIRLVDYDFELSQPLTPGSHVIRVENAGPQPHELVLARLAPGKSAKDFMAWEKGGEKGPPPGAPIGGISPMMPNEQNQFTVEITPGDYVLLCFLPDAGNGKAHLFHGMIKPLKVG